MYQIVVKKTTYVVYVEVLEFPMENVIAKALHRMYAVYVAALKPKLAIVLHRHVMIWISHNVTVIVTFAQR